MSDLPEDLVEKILLRLPAKSLLRSTTVSKKWYKLISNPRFIVSHLNFVVSVNNGTQFLVDYYTLTPQENPLVNFEGYYAIHSSNGLSFQENVGLKFRVEGAKSLAVAGCCNGLVCLAEMNCSGEVLLQDITILYNPVIRRSLLLPKSDVKALAQKSLKSLFRLDWSIDAFGFVYDHVNDDYKVLRLYSWCGISDTVEIFRLSTGLWEDITHKAPLYQMSRSQADLKGIAHWCGFHMNAGKVKILSFHVHDEVFGIIELPETVIKDDLIYGQDYGKYLLSFDESLFLIRCVAAENDNGVNEQSEYKYDIWKMEKYGVVESWKQLQTRVFNTSVKPLSFSKDGEVIWSLGEKEFIATNLENDSIKHLGINKTEAFVSSCSNYVESLVLLDKTATNIGDDQ